MHVSGISHSRSFLRQLNHPSLFRWQPVSAIGIISSLFNRHNRAHNTDAHKVFLIAPRKTMFIRNISYRPERMFSQTYGKAVSPFLPQHDLTYIFVVLGLCREIRRTTQSRINTFPKDGYLRNLLGMLMKWYSDLDDGTFILPSVLFVTNR